ncbi:YaaR family protein [Listeria costaricensis]|uniref:YaaR family protein n=1 Tax=Listeria costaricensis TaxID=2026604 RepID=UPI000C0721A3|nr:YaaR family protein [Listeria costaricensis]
MDSIYINHIWQANKAQNHPQKQAETNTLQSGGFSLAALSKKQDTSKLRSQEIDRLLGQVTEQKEKIELEMTAENVLRYKEAVKDFLNFYVSQVMDYKDLESRHPKYGYLQKMTVAKEIEQKNEQLEDVLNLIDTRTGHLDMLNRIGEISGLILNIVL